MLGSSPVASADSTPSDITVSSTGGHHGQIKQVWLTILENTSCVTTSSGLIQNSYLGKMLPATGALLTNYCGTGDHSMDNYISLLSG